MTSHSLIYLITLFLYLSISALASPAVAGQKGGKAGVTATIPAAAYTRVYGYTAPNAIVQAEGYRVFAQTVSENDGYFKIDPLPISLEVEEICLTTIDEQRRVGFPLCVDVPTTSTDSEIGPLLLSPTLGFSTGSIWQNQTAGASGRTIPNAKVAFSFFETTIFSTGQRFYSTLAYIFNPTVEAAGLPLLETTSNKTGAFSINLPTVKAMGYRVYVAAFYQDSPTPKSHTLLFRVNSFWQYWIRYVLPKLIFLFMILILVFWLIILEAKTKKVSIWYLDFNEKRLSPIAVRMRLRFRRLWYNFQEFWRSNQR